MGASLDVLTTCDGSFGQGGDVRRAAQTSANKPARPKNAGPPSCMDDPTVGCAALEEAAKHALASANRGGTKISDEVLLNHELLQCAKMGNAKGLSAALDRGAWTETRRPLVMKPQKPDVGKGGSNEPSDVGMTALMFAAQGGSTDCIRRLLWAGAEVTAVEEDGWTALHFAAKEGSLEACSLLLQKKANPEALNVDDRTPLQVAEHEDDEFADKLRALLTKGKPKA